MVSRPQPGLTALSARLRTRHHELPLPTGSQLMVTRPQPGLTALSAFFAVGAIIAMLTSIALSAPGSAFEPLWRLNPQAHVAFRALGPWAIALMLGVAA